MMKSSELRIGITCYFTEPNDDDITDCYIDTIEKHDLLRYLETGLPVFNPIPLTEEILLKCGFDIKKYHSNNAFHILKTFEKDDFYINSYDWGFQTDILRDLDIEIKHLHQLQNLYFALTGEELTVYL